MKQIIQVAMRLPQKLAGLVQIEARMEGISVAEVVRRRLAASYLQYDPLCEYGQVAVLPAPTMRPDAALSVPLTQGERARIDYEDGDAVLPHKWHFAQGHAYRRIGGVRVMLARVILGIPADAPGQVVFRNGDRLDCRRANIAWVPDHAEEV